MSRCGSRSVLIEYLPMQQGRSRRSPRGANETHCQQLWLSATTFGDGAMTATGPKSSGFSRTRLARIGSWYQARVNAGDLPGAVVAIARNGKLAYLKAIGFQDRARTIPMNPDTIFWIA